MDRYSDVREMTWSFGDREHNLLLEAPASRELEFDCCVDLLTPDRPENLNVWSLGITLPPDERLRIWEARRQAYPHDFRVLSGQPLPEGATKDRARELGFDPVPRFAHLDDPKNLTRLGVGLTESLTTWEDGEEETVVCFHSITTLLQHVSTEQAYQFLHHFTSTVREFGALAHYHVNPLAHEGSDVELFATLFDGVRDPSEG